MDDKTVKNTEALSLICPTCGARYTLPKYVEGQRYGCKRCSASLMFGKFALQLELGRGGFGVVYKAFQADLQRVVALKFLHTDSEESTERFMREARIAANLNHPNITAIYEVGQHDGKPYITMQFVDGVTANKATFSIREAVAVVRDAATAVDYAHARDIIHRDIKPHNIMVTQERSGTTPADTVRRTFVMDFGLARSANKGGTLTTEGQVMGTPAFMSPEQAEGKTCDPKSDVYSLGATLYSLVTKRPPFEAPTPLQVLLAVSQEEPIPPSKIASEVDPGLEAIILKAMAKDPALRYSSAARLAQDLTSWLGGGVTDAAPTLHLSASQKSIQARRKGRGAMIAVGIFFILAGAAGLVWQLYDKSRTKPATPEVRKTPERAPDPEPIVPVVPKAPIVLLDVRTDPAGATVRIGNREWPSPITLNDREITPGQYEVAISLKGFALVKEKVTLTAGPSPVLIEKKLEREVRKLAFKIESDPAGAKVMLNGADTGGTTPYPVYEEEVRGVAAQVELELAGYVPFARSYEPDGKTVSIKLAPKTGSVTISGAVKGASLYLFPVKAGVKNLRTVASLWSENPEVLEQSMKDLDVADVPYVTERLKTLAARPEPRIRERAASFAAVPASPSPLRPERTARADARGGASLEGVGVMHRYRLFATSPRTQDYFSDELEVRWKVDSSFKIEMVEMATVGVASVRPEKTGQFKVIQADGSAAGTISPGGPPARVVVGPVSLRYVPPANDPILREFVVNVNVTEPYELAGNLYLYCAEAYEKDGNVPMAVRAYTKLLEERKYPSSEESERAKLPERIRTKYKGWLDAYEKQGKVLGGDLAARLDEARAKPVQEALPLLVEIYAAKDAPPAVKGNAAAVLALLHGKLGQPYESMEWIERSLREKVDPGHDAAGAVAGAIRGFPGLGDRWESANAALEALRKSAQAKVDPPPPPGPAPGGKVGTLWVVSATYGIYVKLDPDTPLVKDDVLEVFRNGEIVGEIVVEKIVAPDGTYPNGSAACRRGKGAIQKGDEVRRKR